MQKKCVGIWKAPSGGRAEIENVTDWAGILKVLKIVNFTSIYLFVRLYFLDILWQNFFTLLFTWFGLHFMLCGKAKSWSVYTGPKWMKNEKKCICNAQGSWSAIINSFKGLALVTCVNNNRGLRTDVCSDVINVTPSPPHRRLICLIYRIRSN